MLFYSYEFQWKEHETYIRRSRDFGGDNRSLNNIYSDLRLQEINEDFYSDYLHHGMYVLNVVQRLDTELYVYAAVNIACASGFEWEEELFQVFSECRLLRRKEITIEEFRNEVSMNRCGGSHRILDRLDLKYQNSWMDPLPFKLSEMVPDHTKLTKKAALERARAIMGSQSLMEELERIYSRENRRKYYGHPVHYLISAGDWEAARDIFELLLQALYSNGRLLSSRQTELTKLRRGVYRDDRYRSILRSAEGGVAIIELKTEDDMGNVATDYHELTKVTGMVLEKQKKDTLFIFVELLGKSFKSSEALVNITNKADVIQITEGSGTYEEAKSYLMELTRKVDYEVADTSDAADYLPEAESYTVSDIFNAYNAWYGSGLKNHVYKAYKEQKTFQVEITRVESKPYERLRSLIGVTEAKGVIEQIISASKVMKARERMGLPTEGSSLHMMFSGNPGTAKTTVARLLAQVLKDEDVLTSGKFVECGRQDLVARYVGWTAKAVEEKFREAKGGVLFIDEAYSLIDDRNSFAAEAVNTIIQLMENYRREVIVIFAGYRDKMERFMYQNEGLRSRIAFHLDFPDYDSVELTDILRLMVRDRGYTLDQDAAEHCRAIFEKASKAENFGNGRYVRNLLEQAILRQSQRLLSEGGELSREEMCRLRKEDFREVPLGGSRSGGRMGFAC